MNNMNFSKNNFNNMEPAKIANKVIQNNKDGGVVSINQIVTNMQNIRRGNTNVTSKFEDSVPVVEREQRKSTNDTSNNRSEVERMRLQALKNVGKKW